MKKGWADCLLLVVVCFVVYGMAVGFDSVELDDPTHIFRNIRFLPPTFASLASFWKESFFGFYIPLTYSVWWVLSAISLTSTAGPGGITYKIDPAVFHFSNILLHSINTVLCYWLLRVVLGRSFGPRGSHRYGALIGALLFCLHPVQVETVAWISGLRDLLSTTFGLASLFVLFSADTLDWRKPSYGVALLLFFAALLAKPSLLILPAVAGILIWLTEEKGERKIYLQLVPMFVISLIMFGVAKANQVVTENHNSVAMWYRPFVAGDAVFFYLYKLVLPFWPSFDYGRHPRYLLSKTWGYLTWSVPAFLFWQLWKIRGRQRWPLAAFGILVVSLLPVLGFVSFLFQFFSTVCDHYLYMAMLGPCLLVAYYFSLEIAPLYQKVAIGWLLVLSTTAVAQLSNWRDSLRLFQSALRVNPDSVLSNTNLAASMFEQKDYEAAAKHYRSAMVEKPDLVELRLGYAVSLGMLQRYAEAERELWECVRRKPSLVEARIQLALLCISQERPAEALEVLSALGNSPNLPPVIAKIRDEAQQKLKNHRAVAGH